MIQAQAHWEGRTVSYVSERGDLLELLCDASGRLPALSATVRTWVHPTRQREAIEQARRLGIGAGFPGYVWWQGEADAEMEQIGHLVRAAAGRGFRLEQSDPDNDLIVSDGSTTWRQIAPAEFVRLPPSPQTNPLFDPSWLVDYDWDPPRQDVHDRREAVRLGARPRLHGHGRPFTPGPGPPTEVEVVIDRQLGFLHTMTGLVAGQPYAVLELLDQALDPDIDEQTFRVDETYNRVIDFAEWKRW